MMPMCHDSGRPRKKAPHNADHHVIPSRHSTAMAVLQSGVDIAVIAIWLGHESIETTNVYLHANLATKERALAKVSPLGTLFRRFHASDTLLAFLESL